ncbi:unnamed protein product [Caenorhabditis bovis]|uniref:Rab-3-interacting molecule unc-10 n=1 Tax=Caenorhabditis bovis TaxID=2654633 RepID=A0A8S1EFJ9_9PELO|nr:unnamed protein product [Caenorhabditis bovis]
MDDPSLMPDLSHLSAEEREIIEQVFKRQRDEEAKETQMSQKATEELSELDKQINERKETSRKLVGTQDDAICQICQKTKFADGIGHKCFYCQLRSCARCGGRAQSKNKAIWACSLCQKRQQILAKTGKWFQPEDNVSQPKISVSGPSGTSPSPHSQSQSSLSAHQEPQSASQDQMFELNLIREKPSRNTNMNNRYPHDNQDQPMNQNHNNYQQQNHNQNHGSNMNSNMTQTKMGRTDDCRTDDNRRGNNMFRQQSIERNNTQQMHSQNVMENDVNQRPTFYTENSNEIDQKPIDAPQMNDQSTRNSTAMRVTEDDYSTSANFESKKQRNNHNSLQQIPQVRPCPPADDHMSRVRNRLHRQLRSMSSSEEDILANSALKTSTSAVVAAGGKTYHEDSSSSSVQRLSEECNSEKDLLRYIYGDRQNMEQHQNSINNMKGIQPRRREKSLSVSPSSRNHHDQFGGPSIAPGGDLLASRIRTFLSHPVTWQPSADQKRLIGHMILHRTENSASNGDLGLKIVGGRRTDTGKLGAFITQVKPGSVADTIGRLRPGDEVVEWNGQSLQNATYEQVYDSIAASRYDTQVELIVSRNAVLPGGDDFLNLTQNAAGFPAKPYAPKQFQRQLPNPELFADPTIPAQLLSHSQSAVFAQTNTLPTRNRSTSSYYYPDVDLGVPPVAPYREAPNAQPYGTGHIFGRLEVSFVYSHHDRQLSVALERAHDLPPRPDGTLRNPYVKLFLLPDRSEKSRRQSAVIAETLMPVWNEVFYYNGLTEPMIMQRVLEITVWDYDKFGTNSFLGETLIDLAAVPLDGNHSLMCTLVDMDDDNPLRTRLKLRKSSHHHVPPYRRPQSELNYYNDHSNYYNEVGRSGHDRDDEHDEYLDDDDMENDMDLARTPAGMVRKSRTYDRQRRDKLHGYADWTMNRQSGYMSDHGYGKNSMMPRTYNRRQHRRPRSATALMHMGPEEMYDHKKYFRGRAEEDDYHGSNGSHGSQYYAGENTMYEDSRYKIPSTQRFGAPSQAPPAIGAPGQPAQIQGPPQAQQPQLPLPPSLQQQQLQQQQQPKQQTATQQQQRQQMPQQGYYSDGSETMSVHSCNSMPMITTINRRNMAQNSNDNTSSFEEQSRKTEVSKVSSMASSSSVPNSATASNNASSNTLMKERKKSLMTRFIPGRSGEGKRTGFARSEEVGIPGNMSSDRLVEPTPPFLKQASKESTDSAHSDNWLPVLADGPLGSFVDNLGPGQVVGRQVLASPVLGEIQIGIMAGRSGIDVEIIRAKNLVVKPGVKICPAPYVKVYLMEGKQCVAKAKTNAANKTTSPLFQQHLIFNDSPKKKMLQITVLGDYGRMERKTFMGIAQIRLDDLELGAQPLIGWYKLFHSSSLAGTGPVRKDSDVSVGGAQQ